MEDKIQALRQAFAGDRFVSDCLAAEIVDAGDGYAVCTMTIEDRHKNALGIIMGGVIFTLADFAFAVAANQEEHAVVSQAAQITFLTPARGSALTAKASAIRKGGSTSLYSIMVTDELGTEVAYATANGHMVRSGKG